MFTITRHFRFDAGHRVLLHESKCRHLHGHDYHVELTVSAPELDSLGRVIDFSVLKQIVGTWIDDNWDHNLLLNKDDPFCSMITLVNNGRRPYLFIGNPTAENIAKELFHRSQVLLVETEITVVNVRIYETPNCWADYAG